MANRYWVGGTGTWDGTAGSKWSTSYGGAGGASAPVAGDNVFINNAVSTANVTLGINTPVLGSLTSFSSGTFNASSYTLNTTDIYISCTFNLNTGKIMSTGEVSIGGGTTNLNSGTIEIGGSQADLLSITSSLATLNAGTSLIILNATATNHQLTTSDKTFNDVRINLGTDSSPTTLKITGSSPTFRLLDIRSASSAAHTVNFDSSANITVDKFIAIGSSTSNRLMLNNGVFTTLKVTANGSSYGNYVNINGLSGSSSLSSTPLYIGSGSINTYSAGSQPWLLQDPPKISTLVDPLTTAPGSNTNWTVSGTVTQVTTGHGGGGYSLSSTGSKSITTTDTYDLLDSSIIIEYPEDIPTGGGSFSAELINLYPTLTFRGDITEMNTSHSLNSGYQMTAASPVFVKYAISSIGAVTVSTSTDGVTWSTPASLGTIASSSLPLVRSTRLKFYDSSSGTGLTVGSINPTLISAPSVTTGSATSIGTTSATLAGNVTSDGGATITERGVCWSTSANPTTADSKATSAGTTGSYTVSATSLTANTTYHYRAYATNSEGTSYGSDTTFATSPITDIDGDTATSSTTISSPSLTIGTSLSNNNQVSTVSISSLSLISATNLAIDSMSLTQSISSPSVVLIKGIYPDSMVVGVSENSLDLLLSADLGVNNLSVAVAESSAVVNKTTLMELDNLSLLTTGDNIGLGVNTSISIDPISLSTAIEHGLVSIGYVIPNITSDNIYAIGVIRTGDYEVATNNTDNTYKVVEL